MGMNSRRLQGVACVVLLALLVSPAWSGDDAAGEGPDQRRVVLLAGPMDDHPPNTHEYERAVHLLAHLLETAPNVSGIETEVHLNGWPDDPATLDAADTIVLISGGADRDPEHQPFLVGDRLDVMGRQMERGCGLVVIHWGVFVPIEHGGEEFLEWIGGHFDYETGSPPRNWRSAIQTVTSRFDFPSPDHPVSRGLEPVDLHEEFYYRIRFREDDPRLVPVARVPIPGEDEPQTIAWAVEREDGGRGFGTTGGHFYENYFAEHFQRMLLNAILWTAHAPVPEQGVRPKAHQPVRSLILTGHDHPAHHWEAKTEALRRVLERDPRVLTTIVEDPEFLADEQLHGFDVVVHNYNNWDRAGLSEAARGNLKRYLAEGGAMSLIHFANGAWHPSLPESPGPEWPEFAERIVARAWAHETSGHDAHGGFTVRIAGADHPIARGAEDYETTDELYYRQAGDVPITVLATARSGVTGEDEPQAFVYEYQGARMFQTVLGHDSRAILNEGTARLIRRGTVWAANRDPADFPDVPGRESAPDPIEMEAR